MKPRITHWRNFRGEPKWQCVGYCNGSRHALIGHGDTPSKAFEDWREACDFPF